MNESLQNAQCNLRIQSVNLKESKIFVREGVELSELDELEIIPQSFRGAQKIHETSLSPSDDTDKVFWDYRFIYSVAVRLIFSEESEESTENDYDPVLEILADFEAIYSSEIQLAEIDLKAFCEDNVGYHVWPYWREYVQSSCARIGLSPPIEVPVYIITRQQNEEKEVKD